MRLYGAIPPQTERNAPRPCLQNGAKTMISKPAQAIVERKACRDARAGVQRSRTTPALHDSAGQDIATIHSSQESKNGAETRTAIRHRGGRHGLSRPNHTMSHSRTLLLTLLLQPARAVFISQWANCLSPSINATDPIQLQWVPLYVGTVFATSDTGHKLTVTVWGNVSGTYQTTDTTDANFTATEILRDPFPTSVAKITTLHSEIDVLTYEPYSASLNFCDDALINATCPLGPVTDTTDMIIPYGLPSISMEKVFDTSYAFTSFSPTFEIIYGDAQKTQIGCISATVTPDLGGLAWMLKFLPLFVLIFVGLATIFASIYSPWGTTDIFHWSSNFGRHNDLLRLVTPGFGDCLQYIQFIALTGGLSLSYPGFYQPIVSQASWSVLMFNESFVTKDVGWQSLVDGVYYTNGTYGMESYAQLVGLGHTVDIWAGMMIWLLIVIGSVTVITQLAFAVQWLYRYVRNVQEEDLRNKNLPFTVGNVVRIVFNFFLLPLVALSMFQLVVFSKLYAYTGILAALTILLLLVFAGWLLYLITTTKPRSVLFDDLSTVLLWGPLYNTYSDEAATFALIPALLTFVRGIAIGAVQPSGIAQIVILAICEVVQVISLHAFKPFSSPTSMNAYHTLFAVLRFATIILMITFVGQLGLSDQSKGWVGYVILLIHGGVLVLCFMLNALQTSIEVIARLMGAGGDDSRGLSQGPLLRIFGARQLSRRTSRRGAQSRQSQLSSTAMLAAGEAGKGGYIAPSGRVRSESAGSVNILMNHRHQRSSSAFDTLSFDAPPSRFDNGSTFTPTTPGEASTYSFLPSPATGPNRNVLPASALVADAPGDTFYRPPRRRRPTLENQSAQERARASWATSGDLSEARRSQAGPAVESPENDTNDRGAPALIAYSTLDFPTRTDYATREVDFYYGVQRGSKLNSGAPQRRLGTGPADPTGPVATATGWFRNVFGGKRKEKSKGFEVVRSARMPPAMRAGGGDYDDTDPPEGTPVAMGVLRSGPIDSDSDDGHRRHESATATSPEGPAVTERLLDQDRASLDESGDEAEVPRSAETRAAPVLPDVDAGEAFKLPSRNVSRVRSRGASSSRQDAPELPRKSSKRKSDLIQGLVLDIPGSHPSLQPSPVIEQQAEQPSQSQLQPLATSRLPFESRSSSSNRAPSVSSLGETDVSDLHRVSSEQRPTSLGAVPVHHGNISRFPSDHRGKIQGREAEFVDN